MEANTSATFPTEKHILVRSIVMVVCSLSMTGAVFVILSYVCFKSLRSQARQILVNLSFMDFGIGAANFTGAIVNFDQYYNDTATGGTILIGSNLMDMSCKAQAFVAMFTTYASFFWTVSLAIYMYCLIFQNWQRKQFYLSPCYVLCYGLATGLTLWLLFTGRLGNSPYNSSGWCSIIIVWPGDKKIDFMAATFGYDLWIYLTFLVCLIIYSILVLRMNVEFKDAIQLVGPKAFWMKALEFLNLKLLLIPVAFLLLRMWSCVVNIVFVYCHVDPDSLPHSVSMFLIIMSGIGDSGQGLANGLIFVFFTDSVRKKFFSLQCLAKCFKRTKMNNTDESTRLWYRDELTDSQRRDSPTSVVTPSSSLLIS